jgi:hypothetical protein
MHDYMLWHSCALVNYSYLLKTGGNGVVQQTYPGSAHGVRLFKTEHGDDLRQRLIAFITANAPSA